MSLELFSQRHIGPTPAELDDMAQVVGFSTAQDLIEAVLPPQIRHTTPLQLPPPRSETAALRSLRDIADANSLTRCYIGQGYYGTVTPAVILRNLFENPAWYTAYTPYQPEISQGRLEAIVNFQTMVSDLCALDIANASLLDEGTAAAEAMTLLHRVTKSGGNVFLVDRECHPQTIQVVQGRAEPLGIEVRLIAPTSIDSFEESFGVLVSYPASSGEVCDFRAVASQAHAAGVGVIAATDLLALTLLEAPGTWGADVAIGSAQRLGVPLGAGGPHAGFIATTSTYARSLPGRLVGVSVDRDGNTAYRLALQTREQHIRRERATSNICTAQVLLAVMAGMYGVYHGPEGLTHIADRIHRYTTALATALSTAGVEILTTSWFDTLTVRVADSTTVQRECAERGISLRILDANTFGISIDETVTEPDLEDLCAVFGATWDPSGCRASVESSLKRTTPFMTHPVFHSYRSETAMMRYLRRLADRDLALDRTMIPLGSCTMKLNAASEMLPVSWPQFNSIHPFAPSKDLKGFDLLERDLNAWLCEITGYDAFSLQPNAGSQGEYAGLLAVQSYHQSRGQGNRNVCLIPSSAHGTNAASAALAAMKVVVVACDERGNVDLDDLRTKIEQHRQDLSVLMVTYPSTHGVFEEEIREICTMVHEAGAQVYLDGANMNAMVGWVRPGDIGADVGHLNLHKTFCIPHGGGGPGIGPVGVREHLIAHLPSNVASAPRGSASILPITWMYIAMMGAEGLTAATQAAVVNANYVANQLKSRFPILYSGRQGLIAHEVLIDLRPIEKATGVTVDDVAKRLIDFGFHAPTMSFPVAGTLMIEPTESESREELDRFCDAMMSIADEISAIERGDLSADQSPLRFAPHTLADVTADHWERHYPRSQAVAHSDQRDRYWPPVGRIDAAYGDRNLFCSCPPMG